MEKKYFKRFDFYKVFSYQNYSELPDKNNENFDIFNINFNCIKNSKNGIFKQKDILYGEDNFKLNKKNYLSATVHNRFTVVVEKNDKKLSLKFFCYNNVRNVGEKFYRIGTSCNYITLNFNKNLVYLGKITNYHKKRKFQKKVKVATFSNNFLSDFIILINGHINNNIYGNYELNKINPGIESVESFINSLNFNFIEDDLNYTQKLHKYCLTKKGVKLSNNWSSFSLNYPQPKILQIKKSSYKYLDAIMTINGLNGDKLKKVLHSVKKFNPNNYKSAINIFGRDFILSQSDDFLKLLFENENNFYLNLSLDDINSKKEKNNIFEIFKLTVYGEIDFNTLNDHYSFYNKIKKFEKIKWNSNNYDSFREEHLDWTELNQFYTKGSFDRIYNLDFIEGVQKEIQENNLKYYPIVLLNSREYNDESFIQSNCVKGYINNAHSLIVSLRKDFKESNVRATIEYRINKNKNKIELNRVQTLGRFNKILDEEWNNILNILDKQIEKSIEFFELPKIKCKLGRVEFISESIFEELTEDKQIIGRFNSNDILVWKNKKVNNINNINDEEFLELLNYENL